MAVSGNISWELTRNQMIEQAYAKLGVPGEDNTLTAAQYTSGALALNQAVQLAVTDGMQLWKRVVTELTPTASTQVFTFNDAVKITAVYVKDATTGVQWAIEPKALYDFMRLPTNAPGLPVHWMADQKIQGYTVTIWPQQADPATISGKKIVVVYQSETNDFVSASNTPDFPAYWSPALIYKTAQLLAPELGVPLNDRQQLKAEAKEFWDAAKGMGDDTGSLFLQPRKRY